MVCARLCVLRQKVPKNRSAKVLTFNPNCHSVLIFNFFFSYSFVESFQFLSQMCMCKCGGWFHSLCRVSRLNRHNEHSLTHSHLHWTNVMFTLVYSGSLGCLFDTTFQLIDQPTNQITPSSLIVYLFAARIAMFQIKFPPSVTINLHF